MKNRQTVRAMEVGTGPVASPDHNSLGCKAATSIISHEHLTSGLTSVLNCASGVCVHPSPWERLAGYPSCFLLGWRAEASTIAGMKNCVRWP